MGKTRSHRHETDIRPDQRALHSIPFLITSLWAATIFLNSGLLFWLEPMIGKMILPYLGGNASVWNTCMVFFQVTLLAGYAYAYLLTRKLKVSTQVILHSLLFILALFCLPILIAKGTMPPTQTSPIPWLLLVLTITIGGPFFILSSQGPLLQKWFSETKHPHAKDPYFLFSASNLGSLLALLGYPLFLETSFRLARQSFIWGRLFWLLGGLTLLCIAILVSWRCGKAGSEKTMDQPNPLIPLTNKRRLKWILLSFVPSSLLLGVTTYISSDIAPIPLIWVLPLSLYLLTFIIAFSGSHVFRKILQFFYSIRIFSNTVSSWVIPLLLIPVAIFVIQNIAHSIVWLVGFHLLLFFLIALALHSQLAADRPPASHLAEFYFWMGLGGALGGIFNALIGPAILIRLHEYPLALAMACMLHPWKKELSLKFSWKDLGIPVLIGILAAAVPLTLKAASLHNVGSELKLLLIIPAIFVVISHNRPIRFGLGIMAIMWASSFYPTQNGWMIHSERSFYGLHKITLDPVRKRQWLEHGNTVHGGQNQSPGNPLTPLTYYHPTGPLGQIFYVAGERFPASPIGVIGLGAGSMISYALPEQEWTFFEIDPSVIHIAQDSDYFSFLSIKPYQVNIVEGDGRLSLEKEEDNRYGTIVIDAFGSDSIPVHLLTREAMQVYLSKLKGQGLLAFHISNRYLNLAPILGDLAGDAGLRAWAQMDFIDREEKELGKYSSHWVVMTNPASAPPLFTHHPDWKEIKQRSKTRIWTDDYSSLWTLLASTPR